ncbi:hypothetical protein [Sphingopyxis indica]|uniref:Uncharacterized protein n=1 Tax=Sphingopyxis indica TaxID=436663 RepID=A0A239E9K6_9SPHN|nr:hypothetical protein [Sphingopyxis indica]WOF41649.1 hypothetical protein KNJ79_10235 [Sphingopyxis indica]SNS40713.1 hypothetical protein SAMN06295955_101646 [Sphingopyxis indica]
MSDRYDGKPFLILIDAWVLDAIGHLDADWQATVEAMEPQLRQTFGGEGAWQDIVAEQMKFPDGLGAQVERIWLDGKARFEEARGEAPNPVAFAQMFVDRNFQRAE